MEVDAPVMTAAFVVFFAALGVAAGAAHFLLLRRTVALWVDGGSARAVLALQLGRLALTILVLALAARAGWPALIACAAGVFGGRSLVLRRTRARAP
jgi:hypothetical protein